MDSSSVVLEWFDFVCPFCYVGQQRNEILARPRLGGRGAPGADSHRALGEGWLAATAPATRPLPEETSPRHVQLE